MDKTTPTDEQAAADNAAVKIRLAAVQSALSKHLAQMRAHRNKPGNGSRPQS